MYQYVQYDCIHTIFTAKMSLLGYLRAELLFTICVRIPCTGCLITERSKVEAFYAHLGWNLWVFQTLYSKTTLIHLILNTYNVNYVIIYSSRHPNPENFKL